MAKCLKKDFILFIIVGFVMTFLNFVLLALLVEILHFNYIFSNIISYIIVVVLSYFANSFITFNHKITNKKKEFKRIISYCIMKLIFLEIDTILLYILVDIIKINLYLGKLILTIILTIGSFLFSKIIISGCDNNEN